MSDTTFVRGENPLRADKLNTAFDARVKRIGDTMQGRLNLVGDPVAPLEAATKQYVDRFTSVGVPTGAFIGAAPPGNVLGPLWWDTNSGQLYVQYNDGSSTQWVQANSVTADQLTAVIGTTNIVNVLDHGAKGDGTTDDTVAIQNVLNTYAGKATVLIPWTSASFRTGKLTIPNNTDLLLHGRLFALPGLLSGYIDVVNVVNVTIDGYGSIDANGPAQTAVAGMAGMAIAGSANVTVSSIWITNAFHWNINVTQSNNVVFYGVTFTKGGTANEFAANSDNCWLTNCTVDGTGLGDYAFCFYGGVTNSGALGNVVRNGGAGTVPPSAPPGIGILSDGNPGDPPSGPCSNITIADNIIHDCGGPGISCINVVSGTPQLQRGIIIANNRCYNNNLVASGAGPDADIYVDQTDAVTITGNQISHNGSATSPNPTGMYLGATASHVHLTGNQIYNVGQGRTGSAGIWTNANHVHASGNYIYDSQTTPTMQYSVIGGGGTHNVWVGNFFDLPPNFGSSADTVGANAVAGVWTVGDPGGATDRIMAINGAQGHHNGLQYQTQSQPRWFSGTDGLTDSGGNVGSNYVVAPYNDANLLQSPAISINRTTSNITLLGNLALALPGIRYGAAANYIAITWSGTQATLLIDGSSQGHILTDVLGVIPGWGTSTGGVRGAITGSSTLPQVAAALSQLLTDLKTRGLLAT